MTATDSKFFNFGEVGVVEFGVFDSLFFQVGEVYTGSGVTGSSLGVKGIFMVFDVYHVFIFGKVVEMRIVILSVDIEGLNSEVFHDEVDFGSVHVLAKMDEGEVSDR